MPDVREALVNIYDLEALDESNQAVQFLIAKEGFDCEKSFLEKSLKACKDMGYTKDLLSSTNTDKAGALCFISAQTIMNQWENFNLRYVSFTQNPRYLIIILVFSLRYKLRKGLT
jgi:hypothetical protein